jgi:putative hydrolase of the HAD superfamily
LELHVLLSNSCKKVGPPAPIDLPTGTADDPPTSTVGNDPSGCDPRRATVADSIHRLTPRTVATRYGFRGSPIRFRRMRAIVFDLDGTLLQFQRDYGDILADAIESVEGTVREAWLEAYNDAFFDRFRACEPDPVRRAFATFSDRPDALADALRTREVDACRPPDGVHEDLARLAADHALGVLTNGERAWQRHKLQAYDLDRHFDAVVTAYDAGAHKPDPAPFRLAERRLTADAYAIVGDDDADVDGGRNAGWTTHRYDGEGFGDLPAALEW